MREKLFALGGAALAAGALIAATPALAWDTNSTNMKSQQQASQVKNPSTAFASASVKDDSGQTVGHVTNVKTSPDGMASKIDVALTASGTNGKTVAMQASKLHFNSQTDTLNSSLTLSKIKALPTTYSP